MSSPSTRRPGRALSLPENKLMRLLLSLLVAAAALAAPQVKVLKLSVANPSREARTAENVVVRVADLKRIAPDFNAGNAIVTTSDAATLDRDARTLQTVELPFAGRRPGWRWQVRRARIPDRSRSRADPHRHHRLRRPVHHSAAAQPLSQAHRCEVRHAL
ncbi:exported hypothetical protein [Candidatus Sulfopaludibacter sp. SbA4]|nr:exported hypothetical protein [Candidatus Sulfopaludibacter sp. SbA4]